jgi:hypothetical protein
MSEERKYPIGGYAPGSYTCKCSTCGKQFTGDKRAVQCEPCAIEMMKEVNKVTFFAKYLPEDSNMLTVGGMYWNKQHNKADLVSSSFHLEVLKNGNFQPAKLFLCSRDIQVGDREIYTPTGIKLEHEVKFEDMATVASKEGWFKVIGEISPDALPYVKEGQEFDDNMVEFYISENPPWEGWGRATVEKYCGWKGMKTIKIQGPCSHFH